MKTSIENKKLKVALKFVSRVAKKNSLDILNSIHCHANGSFELTGTNLDTTCRAIVPCKTQEEGKAGLPVSFLQNMAENKFSDSRLEINEGKAAFASGESFSKCETFKLEEYPAHIFTKTPDELCKFCTIPAEIFFPALENVLPHVSKDATRYVLNGAFFEFTENSLTLTATDGKRLFSQEISIRSLNAQKSSYIIPTGMMKAILSIPLDKKNPSGVQFFFKDDRIFVKCGDFEVFGKPIDGHYPNYRAVIPNSKETKNSVCINPMELATALEKNCEFLGKGEPQSIFTFFNGNLSVVSKKDCGETLANVGIKWTKDSFVIAFNPFLLLDLVNSFEDCGEILLEMRDELDPIKISAENRMGVLMPIRLK